MTTFKKTSIYMALASLFTFLSLLFYSIYLNLRGRNTRAVTDKAANDFGYNMLNAVSATLRVKGTLPQIQPGRSYILVSNHTSLFDIPAVFAGIPLSVRMIAKKELFSIPLFGAALKRHEFIKVDRENREKAMEALAEAKTLMETGIIIWAAAEGTRSRTGKLLPFKKGIFIMALEANAIVIPVVIQGANNILPAKTWRFSPDQTVTLTLGEPIDTQSMTLDDRDKLMADVRQQMEHILEQQP